MEKTTGCIRKSNSGRREATWKMVTVRSGPGMLAVKAWMDLEEREGEDAVQCTECTVGRGQRSRRLLF